MSASQSRAVVSNDALQIVSGETTEKLDNFVRSDDLMAVNRLDRTPNYSSDPIAMTLEHCHLATDGHLIRVW